MTTTIDIEQLRKAATMLRTPTASWHRDEMATVLEMAAKRGERKPRARKPKPFDPFTEDLLAKFLKIKYPSRAHGRLFRGRALPLGHNPVTKMRGHVVLGRGGSVGLGAAIGEVE